MTFTNTDSLGREVNWWPNGNVNQQVCSQSNWQVRGRIHHQLNERVHNETILIETKIHQEKNK